MSVATSSVTTAARPRNGLALRLGCYLAGAVVLVPATSNVGGLAEVGHWWSEPITVQKFVVWALLWEFLGVTASRPGRSAGFGGALYWAQTETLRLPPEPRFAWLARFARGTRRTPLDVALYLLVACAAVVLLCSGATHGEPYDTLPKPVILVLLAGLAAVGVRDRTAFLAARPDVYGVLLAVFLGPAGSMAFGLSLALAAIAGAEAVGHLLGHRPMTPEALLLLLYVAGFVGYSGLRPASATGWVLLPVAMLALAGPGLRREPTSVWLFRDAGAEQRFASALVTPGTGWMRNALPVAPAVARAFSDLLPRAVDDPGRYTMRDGAVVARVSLGGAAPAGRGLLATVQHECDFERGQLRVIEVAPPRLRSVGRRYCVVDAAAGVLESGTVRTSRRGGHARPGR